VKPTDGRCFLLKGKNFHKEAKYDEANFLVHFLPNLSLGLGDRQMHTVWEKI
jgi:hypothetical protein